MNTSHRVPFNLDPATLVADGHDYSAVHALYETYKDDLVRICTEMKQVREGMQARGFSADFSDREAELLYLLVRDAKPDVVVEISPCHGYSSSYILAALTDNKKGKLYSYEISEESNGVATRDLIYQNLAPSVDTDRLELSIGDATKATIPKCDILFMDSNHEAWFAAWYLKHLVSIPKLVIVHDILVRPEGNDSVLPKAMFLGIREQYYVLQTLHANKQQLFSVADFATHMDAELKAAIPTRYERDFSDRSVVFAGHPQSADAMAMHRAMAEVHQARLDALIGDRLASVACVSRCTQPSQLPFIKLIGSLVLPEMGYRHPAFASEYADLGLDYSSLTVAELVAAYELALTSTEHPALRRILASPSAIDPPVLASLTANYTPSEDTAPLSEQLGRILAYIRRRISK